MKPDCHEELFGRYPFSWSKLADIAYQLGFSALANNTNQKNLSPVVRYQIDRFASLLGRFIVIQNKQDYRIDYSQKQEQALGRWQLVNGVNQKRSRWLTHVIGSPDPHTINIVSTEELIGVRGVGTYYASKIKTFFEKSKNQVAVTL